MEITAPTPILPGSVTGTTANDASGDQSASADFNSFLTLLTAQLQNQDPLSPLDATEFVAQLASFSSVEQLVGVNERIDGLSAIQGSQGALSVANWIGKDTALSDGTFRHTGDAVSFIAPTAAAGEQIEALIKTPDGNLLRRIAVFPDENGQAQWDGRDSAGNAIAPTDLRMELVALKDGQAVSTNPAEVLRRITAVRGGPDGVLIDLSDGRAIAPELVSRLQEPRPTA